MATKKTGEPGWMWRRAIVYPVVTFCLWRLSVMESGIDSEVNEAIVFWYGMLVASLVLGYAGFATAQDVAAIIATKSGLPYSAQSSPASPTPGTEQGVEGVPPAETVVPASEVKAG